MFDLVFGTIDSLIAFLPLWLRVCLWGFGLGGGSMLMYGWLSDQERIADVKEDVEVARQKMQRYDGEEFGPLLEMVKESLGLSVKQLKIMLGPTLAAGIPILGLLIWMEGAYTHKFPEPGAQIKAVVEPAGALEEQEPTAAWRPDGAVAPLDDQQDDPADEQASVELTWPSDDATVRLVETGSDRPLVTLPTPAPSARITRKSWSHWFFPNPAGYLPADGPVDRVTIYLPTRTVLPFGPRWLQTWHVLFLTVLSFAALGVKVGFDID
jgi:hypothetical protein